MIGRPASFHAGLARGYWIWHDTTGWHLRATHASTARTVFTGVITATNPMTTVKVRDEAHDRVVRSADRRTTTFRFTNYGGVDGLDLTAGCSATVTFRLYADGALVAPSRIHLGAKATAATANPLRVTRTPRPDAGRGGPHLRAGAAGRGRPGGTSANLARVMTDPDERTDRGPAAPHSRAAHRRAGQGRRGSA